MAASPRPADRGRRCRPAKGRAVRQAAIVLLALSAAGVLALDPSIRVTQYAPLFWDEKGDQPVAACGELAQTPEGYLWLGTAFGLVRFDGVRFETFLPSNAQGLASSYVTSLLALKDGSLWIGTANGLSLYRGGRFRSFTTRDGLPHDVVLSLAGDGRGGVWIGTNGGGLAHYSHGRFTRLTTRDGLLSDRIDKLYLDGQGTLWIGTPSGINTFRAGSVAVNSRDSTLLEQSGPKGRPPFLLRGGTLVSNRGGAAGGVIPAAGASCLLEDREGNLWCGGPEMGLRRAAEGVVESYEFLDGSGPFPVEALLEDKEGNLWAAGARGLLRLSDPKVLPFGKPEGLALSVVTSLSEGADGAIWFAGGGGFAVWRRGVFRAFPEWTKAAGGDAVCVLEDPDRGLQLGTTAGLFAVSRGALRRVPLEGLPAGRYPISLCRDPAGRLWVGTRGAGLYRLEGGRSRRYTAADGLTDNMIGALCPSRDGSLWVGGTGGLNRLYPEMGRIVRYTTLQGLAGNYVLSLLEDGEGTLWAGTWEGLTRVKEGRLTPVLPRQGLPSDQLYQVLEDGRGLLWLSSPRGVFSVPKRQLNEIAEGTRTQVSCTLYGASDGLRDSRCWGTVQPAGCKTADGRLWFCMLDGAAAVDAARAARRQPTPRVLIESVLADGRAYRPEGTVEVPPGPRKLEVSFTAPTFFKPGSTRFRYRLAGFDEGWNDAGTRRTAYFTNLPSGDCTFLVEACGDDGVWCSPGAEVAIRLRPFYYETYWFKGLVLMIAVLAAAGGVQWRVKSLQARKRQLEALVAERTSQLEEANRELERLANEDGLTGIPNIRHFNGCLEEEWRRAIRNAKPLSVILIDVDHFKGFNDTYGHPAGDECLSLVATILKGRLRRPGDVAARYGGEEFVVLLVNADSKGAAAVARELNLAVQALGIRHEGSDAAKVVTISLGCATALPREGQNPRDLIAAADHALYRSKREGRNRVTSVDLTEVSEDSARWT